MAVSHWGNQFYKPRELGKGSEERPFSTVAGRLNQRYLTTMFYQMREPWVELFKMNWPDTCRISLAPAGMEVSSITPSITVDIDSMTLTLITKIISASSLSNVCSGTWRVKDHRRSHMTVSMA